MMEPPFTPGLYRVTFDRIGRDRPGPLLAPAGTGPDLADAVYRYADPHIGSSDLEVDVKFDGGGFLTVGGMRDAGTFRWELIRAPKRIQLRRTKGWRMPAGAVSVARPTRWGNPFRWHHPTMGLVHEPGIGGDRPWDYEGRISRAGNRHDFHFGGGRVVEAHVRWATRAELVELFRLALVREPTAGMRMAYPSGSFVKVTVEEVRRDLAGRDLACWCPDGQPCHADVLLGIANSEAPS